MVLLLHPMPACIRIGSVYLPIGRNVNLQDGSVRYGIVDLVSSNLANSHLLGGGLPQQGWDRH
jgi:hypothetical protein